MRKSTLLLCLFLSFLQAFSQSESSSMIQVDTTIIESSGNGPCNGGIFPTSWTVRIRYAADGTTRPTIFNTNGAGEVGHDTSNISIFGPFYWLNHGWDGGVQLGNGKHYPNFVGIMQPAVNQRPWHLKAVLDTLKKYYPQLFLTNSFYVMGLSEGVSFWQDFLAYQPTAGSFPGMQLIDAMVDLEGQSGETDFGCTSTPSYPAFTGYWATNYGGKFMGLEGTQDSRSIWQITQNMNAAVANSAYFCYQNFGGGGHCCWNSEYDPSQTNWTCVGAGSPGNANLVPTTSNPASTQGNYVYSATTGTNLYQWLLRQGDTSLKGSSCTPTVTAGSNQSFFLPQNSATTTGSVTLQCGHSAGSLSWAKTSGPGTPTITAPTSLTTSFTGLTAGTYVFTLTVTDASSTVGSGSVTIVVKPEVPPTVTPGGPYTVIFPASSATIGVTATGNGGATITTYAWTKTSGPGSTTITGNTTATPGVSGLTLGTYVFHCVVTDNNGNTGSADVTVLVGNASTYVATRPGHTVRLLGEYLTVDITPVGKSYILADNVNIMGTGGVGSVGISTPINVPTGTYWTGACGLHLCQLVDTTGKVFTWSDNDMGQAGTGTVSGSPNLTPVQILTDSLGNPFVGIQGIVDYYTANQSQGVIAWKQGNDTLWTWGDTRCGMKGNGTYGDTSTRPVPLVMPGGRIVADVKAGSMVLVRFTDGTAWTWGGGSLTGGPLTNTYNDLGYTPTTPATDYLSPHPVANLGTTVTQIAGGMSFNYALTTDSSLYNWGNWGGYQGDPTNGTHHPLPVKDTAITNRLPRKIVTIGTIATCTHVILTDSTLWGWGNNPSGEIGYGVEPNNATRPFPYNWDPGNIGDYLVQYPQQVTHHHYKWLFSANPFVYHFSAEDALLGMFSSGRNKGCVIADSTKPCGTGDIAANFANSWDHPDLASDAGAGQNSVATSNCAGCPLLGGACSDCSGVPTATVSSSAGLNQLLLVGATSTMLDGSGSTCSNGKIVYNKWVQLTGPTTGILDVQGNKSTLVTGLAAGVYTFQHTVTANDHSTSTATVSITIPAAPATIFKFPFRVTLKTKTN